MPSLFLSSLKQVYRAEDIEMHLYDLLRQKQLIQDIEQVTNGRIDFGDLLETNNLLNDEIEHFQEKLRHLNGQKELIFISGIEDIEKI